VELEVVTVMTVEPEAVTVGGLKETPAPEGRPEAEKLTEPVNPGPGTTEIV
jgi:hypothetical protein